MIKRLALTLIIFTQLEEDHRWITCESRPISILASLRHLSDGGHACGAAILNERYLLTAAHCTENETPDTVYAVVGSVYLDQGGVSYNVSDIIIHPKWVYLHNDISLVKLSNFILFNDNTKIINLPVDVTINPGDDATATGWGQNSTNGNSPNQLQYLIRKVISNEECISDLQSDIIPSQICFGGQEGHGLCYGDSGSPLVYTFQSKSYAIGIVSWGVPCAVGYPDVFTRVSYYIDWIRQIISDNS